MPVCRNSDDILSAGMNLRVNWDSPLALGMKICLVPIGQTGRTRELVRQKLSANYGNSSIDSSTRLPGNGNCSIADYGNEMAGSISIACYLRVITTGDYIGAGIENYVSEANNAGCILQMRLGEGLAFLTENNNASTSYILRSTTVTAQTTGSWHLVGTTNQATRNLYVNGKLDATETSANAAFASPPSAASVSWYQRNATARFGYFYLWNRVLTLKEVQTLYSPDTRHSLFWRPGPKTYFYAQAPSRFSATAAVTTGATTCSGSATHTPPTYTATAAVTTTATTCSGSATFTAPTYTAAASVTIAAASCSAAGTFTKPVYSGTSTLTVGHATASGAATFSVPVYTASASVAVGATVVNVAGSVVAPTFTGAAAVSVGAAVASGVASNNFVAGPYRVAARQVFVPGAVAFQVRTTGASAAQVF